MGELTLTTVLQPRGPAAAIVLDDAQVKHIGEGPRRFPVAATINGYTWRTTVTRMRGEFLLGLNKEVRAAAGAEAGDTVTATIALDQAPREVEAPAALTAALESDPAARERYEALAFTHRKEFARWIGEAKQETTRERRVAKTLEMLHAGQTRS